MTLTLKAARVNNNYTQQEAAKLLGISKYTLSNWERGINYPDTYYLKRIEETYGVSYNDLIFLPKRNA